MRAEQRHPDSPPLLPATIVSAQEMNPVANGDRRHRRMWQHCASERTGDGERHTMAELNWSDAQWQKVNDAVTEAFGKASVSSALLPCYGPLSASAENVRKEELDLSDPKVVQIVDNDTIKLFNLRKFVWLSNEQVADESLSGALLAFRRAANKLALVQDDIVFNGYGEPRNNAIAILKTGFQQMAKGVGADRDVVASGPDGLKGLVHAGDDGTAKQIRDQIRKPPKAAKDKAPEAAKGKAADAEDQAEAAEKDDSDTIQAERGRRLVGNVAAAIVQLEKDSHPGPFACILGHNLFVAAHTPSQGLVLPADRIKALLNGPLFRSGQMGPDHGIVVSQAGNDIDLVVATPPKVQFLQVDEEARYIFRVYEKFILRIKDKTAVQGISA